MHYALRRVKRNLHYFCILCVLINLGRREPAESPEPLRGA